ncbi:MAG: HlyD family secretion protein [Acidobacteriota bacterium]
MSWLLAVVLLLVGAVAFALFSGYFKPAADTSAEKQGVGEPAAAQATDTQETAGEVLKAAGYIVAHHKIQIGSKVMGKVAWIGVEKGDKVRQGQPLVRLDDREYRAQAEQAEAALRAAEARLKELETGNRPEEVARAEAELARYRADAANAALEWKRLQTLLDSGAVAQQQVDNARSRADMAEAAVKVAERNLELMRLGPRAEQISSARAEVDRARASLDYARTLLDATVIRAPIDGTVLQRIVEVGEMVTTSFAGEMGAKSAVVSLADLMDLQVELDISQSDFNRLSPDQDCVMSPEAYPDRKYRCRIDEIAPEANRQKATIQVKVKVLEPDSYLRPEMTANVTFTKDTSSAALVDRQATTVN